MPVAREEKSVGQAGRVDKASRYATLEREDRFGREARAHAVPLPPAAELADLVTKRPRDHLLRVIGDRLLERDPRLRKPGHIDGEYQRFHVSYVACGCQRRIA